MGVLEDVLSGAIKRAGVNVVELRDHTKAITFDDYDAIKENADLLKGVMPEPAYANLRLTENGEPVCVNRDHDPSYTNWGLAENGEPVCIDYPPGVKIR